MTTPDGSESWIDPIFDAVVSELQLSGYFDKVQTHEFKRKPGYGLWAAVWLQSLEPTFISSGLASSSALAVFIIRMYSNMLKDPEDAIDPNMMRAGANIMRRWHDNFDFGLDPPIRNVDVFGEAGVRLSLESGYIELDNGTFRTMDIVLPIILNDVWVQTK